MEKGSLYKVFAGRFYLLDAAGRIIDHIDTNNALFLNTYGLVLMIQAATKGRCYAYYFARHDGADDCCRTIFPIGRIAEEDGKVSLKTRYYTYVWDSTSYLSSDNIETLFQHVKERGEEYIPGLTKHPGVQEYFDRDSHFDGNPT